MKILAFVGSQIIQHARIVKQMEQSIEPDYRVKRLRLNAPGSVPGSRLNVIRRECGAGLSPDTVLCVMGVANVDEYKFLKKHKALFCLLPGALPRLLTLHDIEIDDDFIFVTDDPEALETAAKRRVYCDPEAAFSRCLVAELARQRKPEEVVYRATR